MAGSQYKSRSWKRKVVKRSGVVTIMFKRSRIDRSRCICGRLLPGVALVGSSTDKKTARPFGGNLCAKCMRKMMIEDARGAQ